MTDCIDPKAIADELRACVERGTYSWGGYKYAEVGPEDAILAAAAVEALVKERDDLAAVVEKVREVSTGYIDQPGHGDYYIGMEAAGEGILEALSTAAADAIREHDAALIESLADEWSEWETFTASDGHRSIRQHGLSPNDWLRARAQQIREERADG